MLHITDNKVLFENKKVPLPKAYPELYQIPTASMERFAKIVDS